MTIKEMIAKVDAYNEIAKIVGGKEMKLKFKDVPCCSEYVTDYKSFRKFVRDTYIKCVADAILNGDYEFETEKAIEVEINCGLHTEIETAAVEFIFVCGR